MLRPLCDILGGDWKVRLLRFAGAYWVRLASNQQAQGIKLRHPRRVSDSDNEPSHLVTRPANDNSRMGES